MRRFLVVVALVVVLLAVRCTVGRLPPATVGTAMSEWVLRTRFEVTVRAQDSRFSVLDLPVYVP